MKSEHYIWQVWANTLHTWGIGDWVASLLESAGPLTLLGAQAVYLSQPFLNFAIPRGHLDALAHLLEDSTQTQAFAHYLRENPSSEPV